MPRGVKALADLDGVLHAAEGYGVTTAACGVRLSYWTTTPFDVDADHSCEDCAALSQSHETPKAEWSTKMTQSKDAMTAAQRRLRAGRGGAILEQENERLRALVESMKTEANQLRAALEEAAAERQPTHPAPEHYNDVRLDAYLSDGVWNYQIVATEYHGNEVRINVDPDTLVRFAIKALTAAVHDKASGNGYWTRPWAES